MLCEQYSLYNLIQGPLDGGMKATNWFWGPTNGPPHVQCLASNLLYTLPNFTTNKGKAPIQGGTGTTKGEDLRSPKLRMLEIRCGKTRVYA